jgi:hypothetical protein
MLSLHLLTALQVSFSEEVYPPKFCMYFWFPPIFHCRNNITWPVRMAKFLVIEYINTLNSSLLVTFLNKNVNKKVKFEVVTALLTPLLNTSVGWMNRSTQETPCTIWLILSRFVYMKYSAYYRRKLVSLFASQSPSSSIYLNLNFCFDSSVGIVTRLRAGQLEVLFLVGAEIFFSSPSLPDQLWSPPSLLSNRYRGKTAEAWSRPLTPNALSRLRTSGAISSLPQYVFMAWCVVKHSNKFNFLPFVFMFCSPS